MPNEKCSAPWCSNPSSSSTGGERRTFKGKPVCRTCYQYMWEQSVALGMIMKEMEYSMVNPPHFKLPAIQERCARRGCQEIFPGGVRDCNKIRRIGDKRVCRRCYQTSWEYVKKHPGQGIDLVAALELIPSR